MIDVVNYVMDIEIDCKQNLNVNGRKIVIQEQKMTKGNFFFNIGAQCSSTTFVDTMTSERRRLPFLSKIEHTRIYKWPVYFDHIFFFFLKQPL